MHIGSPPRKGSPPGLITKVSAKGDMASLPWEGIVASTTPTAAEAPREGSRDDNELPGLNDDDDETRLGVATSSLGAFSGRRGQGAVKAKAASDDAGCSSDEDFAGKIKAKVVAASSDSGLGSDSDKGETQKAGAADASSSDGFGSGSDDEKEPEKPAPKGHGFRRGSREAGEKVVVLCHRAGSAVEVMFKGLQERFDALEAAGVDDEDETMMMKNLSAKAASPDLSFVRLMTPIQFNTFLRYYDIDLEAIEQSNARSLRDLWLEVVWQTTNLEKYADPDGKDGFRVRRLVKVLVVELQAEIDGRMRFLTLSSEGQRQNLNQRVTVKMFLDETDVEGLGRCMLQNFALEEAVTKKHMEIVECLQHEELRDSAAYPGLTTTYDMHTLHIRVRDPSALDLVSIGLPDGCEFETSKGGGFGPVRTRVWAWVEPEEFHDMKRKSTGLVLTKARTAMEGALDADSEQD